ncbi:Glycosyltransferase involved in cell wall bisynthesis [Bradyrhizobium lablabi]|uniref:Glycosyltransferase involved in cell wall bisynthesis n=2 Tax=Bradyrhizobium lablabi TaxID=722472 RepID=A0A1M6MQ39_9BRAD|nr:Glycosyltransferase involved in cell wall bisynthesis [Bradyrhizobium lablabi]
MKIAYLINQYPKVSHTFIRREISALEGLGISIDRVAIRGWKEPLVDDLDLHERTLTFYILGIGFAKIAKDVLTLAISRPLRFFRALSEAIRFAQKTDRPRFYHLIYLAEACTLARYCEQHTINHVHAHFGTNPAEVATLASIVGNLTYSFTVHGPDEFDCPEFLGLRKKIQYARFVAAISFYTKSQLLRWADQSDWSKVHVIRCGLETRYFSEVRAASLNQNRFVSVGRLSRQKGQLILLQAVALLVKEGRPIQLVLAGDGELRDEIEHSIDRLNLRSNVVVTGWVSNDSVRKEIEHSRALVLSSFAEGLPVVLMEAMAMARPVLTSSVAGIPELVRNGQEGWVYPPSSVEETASALRECLMASSETIDQLGQQAKSRCAEFHIIDKSAANLAALLRSMVQSA